MSRRRKAAEAPEPPELGQLMPLAAAAQRLSVTDKTLRRMIDRRQIRAVRIGFGRGVWRISEAELRRVIAEGTSPP